MTGPLAGVPGAVGCDVEAEEGCKVDVDDEVPMYVFPRWCGASSGMTLPVEGVSVLEMRSLRLMSDLPL